MLLSALYLAVLVALLWSLLDPWFDTRMRRTWQRAHYGLKRIRFRSPIALA